MLHCEPEQHRFEATTHEPTDMKGFVKSVRSEYRLLRSCLPKGIFVKAYESRMDLLSVLVEGPTGTPYEDGLFLFDVQLPPDYPVSPPLLHYVSNCSERLNPNLYEDGKVCISLLGTWTGRGTEVWSATQSNLLQVLLSVQGLILCAEPYYNEAGYEKHRGSQTGFENSRLYNEMVLVKLIQSMNKMLSCPPTSFSDEILSHMQRRAHRLVKRLEHWLQLMPVVSGASVLLPSSHPPPAVPPPPFSSPPLYSQLACGKPDEQNRQSSDEWGKLLQEICDSPESAASIPSSLSKCPVSSDPTCLVSSDPCQVLPDPTWLAASSPYSVPDFPLLPVSKGFRLTLLKAIHQFKITLTAADITEQQL